MQRPTAVLTEVDGWKFDNVVVLPEDSGWIEVSGLVDTLLPRYGDVEVVRELWSTVGLLAGVGKIVVKSRLVDTWLLVEDDSIVEIMVLWVIVVPLGECGRDVLGSPAESLVPGEGSLEYTDDNDGGKVLVLLLVVSVSLDNLEDDTAWGIDKVTKTMRGRRPMMIADCHLRPWASNRTHWRMVSQLSGWCYGV